MIPSSNYIFINQKNLFSTIYYISTTIDFWHFKSTLLSSKQLIKFSTLILDFSKLRNLALELNISKIKRMNII